MQKKKLLLLLICFILLPAEVFCQVRPYVGIVEGKYAQPVVTFLESFRDSLKKEGYISYSKVIDGYLKGKFGSGFVYVAEDGTNYIITNRHVVSDMENASIEFEGEGGTKTKYEDLTILAIDEDVDIAILAFPDNQKPFKEGLKLYTGKLADGQDVWSAGFPGLGGEPMWQLGKGVITNSSARIADLIDPAVSDVIQHSAQVDPGNSGGPLLITSPSDPSGYTVVGINTWGASGRQAANFAIPSPAVQAFIKKTLHPEADTTAPAEVVRQRAGDILEKLSKEKSDFTFITKYISDSYVAENGLTAFKEVLQSAPSSVRSFVASEFSGYSPVEGMRYALAYKIEKSLRDADKAISVEISSVEEGDDGVITVTYANKDKTRVSKWALEQNVWRIVSFENSGKDKQEKKADSGISLGAAVTLESPFENLFLVGYGISITDKVPGSAEIGMFFKMIPGYLFWGVLMDVGYGTGLDKFSGKQIDTFSFGAFPSLRAQLPLSFSWGVIAPYAQFSVGLAMSLQAPDLTAGALVEGGVLVGTSFDTNLTFFLSLSYRQKMLDMLSVTKTARHSLQSGGEIRISAGMGW